MKEDQQTKENGQFPVIKVNGLKTYFRTENGLAKAVDDVSFSVFEGETLGLVGESGCGKSVTVMSILGLLPKPPAEIAGGTIYFEGKDILSATEDELRRIRGKKISMIFQEPMTSLNPVQTCGSQVAEVLQLHLKMTKSEAKTASIDLLRKVGIPLPEQRFNEYPHQLSGGMRQRVMIAMALACRPKVLLADEPTTALDVTVQAQILKLIKELQKDIGMSMVLITHDLGVIAETCDRVAVMYASKIVETASVKMLFQSPRHPYTIGLLRAIPKMNENADRLYTIEGTVPQPTNYPKGCHFCTRCDYADSKCWTEKPPLETVTEGHQVACWKTKEINAFLKMATT
ncbi:MAG: ABC transporter ATP-binding protein [Chloroherpetonaceae bacterium]|nr:ABC transporter ATP-binding protein [Chloroherpetonaceae bacterium]